MEVNLNDIYRYIMLAVPKCGRMLREVFDKDQTDFESSSSKKAGHLTDIVASTENQIATSLSNCIKAKFPNHNVIVGDKGSTKEGQWTLTNDPLWVVSPLDGKTNFVHSFPQCAISVAFFLNKEVQIGIVYNPLIYQIFSAIRGQGAFMNGKIIHTSGVTDLNMCQVATELKYGTELQKLQMKMNNLANVAGQVQSIRCIGSSALEGCYVARGSCDVFYDYGTHIWDIAATVLIAKEAGCAVIDPSGGDFNFLSRRILIAATSELATKFAPLLTTVTYDTEFSTAKSTGKHKTGSSSL